MASIFLGEALILSGVSQRDDITVGHTHLGVAGHLISSGKRSSLNFLKTKHSFFLSFSFYCFVWLVVVDVRARVCEHMLLHVEVRRQLSGT